MRVCDITEGDCTGIVEFLFLSVFWWVFHASNDSWNTLAESLSSVITLIWKTSTDIFSGLMMYSTVMSLSNTDMILFCKLLMIFLQKRTKKLPCFLDGLQKSYTWRYMQITHITWNNITTYYKCLLISPFKLIYY